MFWKGVTRKLLPSRPEAGMQMESRPTESTRVAMERSSMSTWGRGMETTWKLPAGAVPVDAQSKKAAENEAIRQRRSSFKGRRMSAKQSFRVSDMDQFGKALEQDF